MNESNTLPTQSRHIKHMHGVLCQKYPIENLDNLSDISFDIVKELLGVIFSVQFI